MVLGKEIPVQLLVLESIHVELVPFAIPGVSVAMGFARTLAFTSSAHEHKMTVDNFFNIAYFPQMIVLDIANMAKGILYNPFCVKSTPQMGGV